MTDAKTQAQVASDLAAFLTTRPSGYGGSGKTPLEELLHAQITQMARQIAAEVIAATPELADHIRRMAERTVREALNNDTWLNQTVLSAVSKAITDLALERRDREDDE